MTTPSIFSEKFAKELPNFETLRNLGSIAKEFPNLTTLSDLGSSALYLIVTKNTTKYLFLLLINFFATAPIPYVSSILVLLVRKK